MLKRKPHRDQAAGRPGRGSGRSESPEVGRGLTCSGNKKKGGRNKLVAGEQPGGPEVRRLEGNHWEILSKGVICFTLH